MAAIALEIQHRVDHVLEHARAGDAAFLGDVADQHEGEIVGLGGTDQLERAGAHLGHRARRTVDGIEPHRLDRIDDHQRGVPGPLQAGGDVADIDRGSQFDRGVGNTQATGAQADLLDGFLAGDVEHAFAGRGETGCHLEQKRGLADAGITADEHRRGRDKAAAKHPVAGSRSRWRLWVVGQQSPRRPAEADGLAGRAFGLRVLGGG